MNYLCLNLGDVGVAPGIVGSCLNVAVGIQVSGQERLLRHRENLNKNDDCGLEHRPVFILPVNLFSMTPQQEQTRKRWTRYLLADEGSAKVVGGGRSGSTHGERVGNLEVGGQDLGDITASSIKDMVGQEGVYFIIKKTWQ